MLTDTLFRYIIGIVITNGTTMAFMKYLYDIIQDQKDDIKHLQTDIKSLQEQMTALKTDINELDQRSIKRQTQIISSYIEMNNHLQDTDSFEML
jgi:peptidoglycan hydrolase CwlO-like protein